MNDADVLQSIPDEDIPKLRELFKDTLPRACYIYNYLESVTKWKKQCPDKNLITFMAPHGNWKNGTFVAVHQYACYEVAMFTREEDCETLCEALVNTKKIKWNEPVLLYAVYSEHYPKILKALEKTTFRFLCATICDIVWLPKEKALNLKIDCPPEVYVGKLNKSHASVINSHWPHRYKDSENYIATIIEMNGGCGIFRKSDGTLVAWVLRNLLGLGALQTADDYKRKGYGSLVTKALSKEIAEKGADVIGTVLQDNSASHAMFRKLGFEILEQAMFVESQEMRS